MRLPKRFEAVNAERISLLCKKFDNGLTKVEAERLVELEKDVDDMFLPSHRAAMRNLRRLRARIDRIARGDPA